MSSAYAAHPAMLIEFSLQTRMNLEVLLTLVAWNIFELV